MMIGQFPFIYHVIGQIRNFYVGVGFELPHRYTEYGTTSPLCDLARSDMKCEKA